MMAGMKNGLTLRTPRSMRVLCVSSMVSRPPIPEPTIAPIRCGSSLSTSRPESFTAMSAAASANWMNRSLRRTSLRSMNFSGSKPLTSPAIRVGKVEAS